MTEKVALETETDARSPVSSPRLTKSEWKDDARMADGRTSIQPDCSEGELPQAHTERIAAGRPVRHSHDDVATMLAEKGCDKSETSARTADITFLCSVATSSFEERNPDLIATKKDANAVHTVFLSDRWTTILKAFHQRRLKE